MDLGLKGKTALVLAAGGGLGRATAIALAKEGANVAIAGIRAKSIDETMAELAPIGGRCMSLLWDLGDLSVIDANISKVEAELGPIDILVNNTGGPPPTTAVGQDPALWSHHFQAMVLCVIAITDRVLPGMKARKWGRIITNTSSGIIAPIPNLGISNTLRASLVGWSKTLSREVAKDGITANIVVPGRIATARVAALNKARAQREGLQRRGGRRRDHLHDPRRPLRPARGIRRPRRVPRQRAHRLHHRIDLPHRRRHDPQHLGAACHSTQRPSKHSKASPLQPSRRFCSRRVCATSGCAAQSLCVPANLALSGRHSRAAASSPGAKTSPPPESWASPTSTRAAIECMPPGCVAVVDAMGVTDAGIFGDILCERIRVREVAGLVSDGVIRDLAGVLHTNLPVWCQGTAAPSSVTGLTFVGWQVPIACGGVAVFPDDIIVADDDGAVVIPAALLDEVVAAAVEQEKLEAWIIDEVRSGHSLLGLYPPNAETKARYAAVLRRAGRGVKL